MERRLERKPATSLDSTVNKLAGFLLTAGGVGAEVGSLVLYAKLKNVIPSVAIALAGLYGFYLAKGYFQQAREIDESLIPPQNLNNALPTPSIPHEWEV